MQEQNRLLEVLEQLGSGPGKVKSGLHGARAGLRQATDTVRTISLQSQHLSRRPEIQQI